MNNGSTSFEARLRQSFLTSPIGRRVILPTGSPALVKGVQDTDTGRLYKVQGIGPNGHFLPLDTLSCWFAEDELRLPYHTVSIHPDWVRS